MSLVRKKIVVFASGSGSTFAYLAQHLNPNEVSIGALFCSRGGVGVIDRAKEYKVPVFVSLEENQLIHTVRTLNPELIVLAGYLKKLTKEFVEIFSGKIINVHPSLLPKFGGQGMYGRKIHQAVFMAKEAQTGATVHIVDEEYDSGKILAQKSYLIRPDDTVDTIEASVREIERQLLVDTIHSLLQKESI
jgi:phosphoribosylglycinamide formyltransferase 1